MPDHQKIIAAISSFINGRDTSDIKMLKDVLHKDFRVSSNNFMGSPGAMLISRVQYLPNIQKGVFGGVQRKMTIESIDQNNSIAMVKL
ncbi:MAG: nuclear transport factor 2 family protein [Daejeonella sp.]|uniref:nuclear transport factor 2 family protein n=1 Tax=Daejeonella sp. TaxID=2805397 RepID=UPI002732AF2A|nr:nuclear transport factor 2 family protein [Daejeonella sp.]MDP3467624.1 nuclear transport factor 2 family protein [Daejeonella sp.]